MEDDGGEICWTPSILIVLVVDTKLPPSWMCNTKHFVHGYKYDALSLYKDFLSYPNDPFSKDISAQAAPKITFHLENIKAPRVICLFDSERSLYYKDNK